MLHVHSLPTFIKFSTKISLQLLSCKYPKVWIWNYWHLVRWTVSGWLGSNTNSIELLKWRIPLGFFPRPLPPACVVSSWLPLPRSFCSCWSILAKYGSRVDPVSILPSRVPQFISWNQGERRRQTHSLLSLLWKERLLSRLSKIITNQKICTGERCSKSACTWFTAQGSICGRKIIFVSCRIMPAVGSVYDSHYTSSSLQRAMAILLPACSAGPLASHKVSHGCLVLTERAHSTLSWFA